MLKNRLVQCLDKEGVLHEGQAGFRSCMDNVFSSGAAAEGARGRTPRQYSSRGVLAPPPHKIGVMTTECVLLLLHALDAFRSALLLCTRVQKTVANCVTRARTYLVPQLRTAATAFVTL